MARTSSDELAPRWDKGITILSLALVIGATTFPLDFSFEEVADKLSRFLAPTYFRAGPVDDLLRNLLLFIPVGFSLTYLMHTRKVNAILTFTMVMIASSGLSFVVELLQVFLSSRNPTLVDVMRNSIGGFLGYLCFRFWGEKIIARTSTILGKSREWLTINRLMVCFAGYTLFILLLSIPFQSFSNVSYWDQSFPLLLGNERTGDRPWRGTIADVYLTDRAISEDEVKLAFSDTGRLILPGGFRIAQYELKGNGPYRDLSGHLSDLHWRGKSQAIPHRTSTSFTPHHWLETDGPVTFLTQKVMESNKFTFITTAATANTAQSGPARIISVSNNPYERNFTLAQEGADLIFRFRTVTTGNNGANPELMVPDVFSDTLRHSVVITYDGSNLQIYIDKFENRHSLEFGPGLAIVSRLIPPSKRIDIGAFISKTYKMLYFGFVFIPLGVLLALITAVLKGRFVTQFLMAFVGIAIPSVILELVLSSVSGRILKVESLVFGMAIISVTMLLTRKRAVSFLRTDSAH